MRRAFTGVIKLCAMVWLGASLVGCHKNPPVMSVEEHVSSVLGIHKNTDEASFGNQFDESASHRRNEFGDAVVDDADHALSGVDEDLANDSSGACEQLITAIVYL